jgi:hypothetical protein
MEGVPRFVGRRRERIGNVDVDRRGRHPQEDGSRPAQARHHVLRPARAPIGRGGAGVRRTAVRRPGGGHGAGRVHPAAEELLRAAVTGASAREKRRERIPASLLALMGILPPAPPALIVVT